MADEKRTISTADIFKKHRQSRAVMLVCLGVLMLLGFIGYTDPYFLLKIDLIVMVIVGIAVLAFARSMWYLSLIQDR